MNLCPVVSSVIFLTINGTFCYFGMGVLCPRLRSPQNMGSLKIRMLIEEHKSREKNAWDAGTVGTVPKNGHNPICCNGLAVPKRFVAASIIADL